MASGNDQQLVEIAAELVPLATDGCTVDLLDGSSVVCVAATHLDSSIERDLYDLGRRARHNALSRCSIVAGGKPTGELVAWGSRTLEPLGEALVCGAAGHIGAVLEARQERRRADEAEAARASIVTMIGHEIRGPLQALTVGLDLLEHIRVVDGGDHVPRALVAQRCELLGVSVARLTDVTRRLLDISRLESPADLDAVEDDLGAIVDGSVARLRDAAEWVGSPIDVTHEGSLRGRWDRPHVETVIDNLLGNAIKYGAGRPIAVRLEGAPHEVRIEVADRGCGISKEELGRVFERFFRGSAPGHHGGLGVGLWIVKKLVDAHGGSVSCESKLGEGSTFRVTLPRDVSRADRGRGRSESLREGPPR
ncbi:MAG: sensor histidine kinase [Myxococcaceae bacterium]|nr:sensor histidine kinase [Myxococcaceae bacterium]